MLRIVCRVAACALLLASMAASAATPTRLLFVGNSLTYVGNLPAVLDALGAANGRTLASDMLVSGGATLAERAADGSVMRALAARHYDFLVLQERGGDLIGAPDELAMRRSQAAHKSLALLARSKGIRTVLLGTYQRLPEASRALVAAEAALAKRLTIDYVGVSQHLQAALKAAPDADWFAADHAHPGPDLTLLDALLLYRKIFGADPRPTSLVVHAPRYGVHAGFSTATLVRAPEVATAAAGIIYSQEKLAQVQAFATLP